jgi:DNA repair exonuclease SbcCD ATPase subunit
MIIDLKDIGVQIVKQRSLLTATQVQLDESQTAKRDLEALIDEAPKIAEAIDDLDELRELELELRNDALKDKDLEGQAIALEEKIEGLIRARNRQIEQSEGDLAGKRRQAALLESVPCQNISLNLPDVPFRDKAEDLVKADTRGCQFLLDAVRAGEDLPMLEKALGHLKRDKSHIENHLKALSKLRGERDELGFVPAALSDLQKKIASVDEGELNKKAHLLTRAMAETEALDKDIRRYSLDIEKYSDLIADLEARRKKDKERKLEGELAKLDLDISNKNEELAGEEDRLNWHNRELGSLKERIRTAEENKKAMEFHQRLADKKGREIRLAGVLREAFGRDGIPFLILERALPHLETTVNSLLEGSEVSIMIDPVRDLESGKIRDEVNIRFTDENGEQVLEDASGYQGNLLGVALRAGIAELQADHLGVRPDVFIIDEGFGAYDAENVPHAREMIHRLADRFGRVLFITHIPEVQEAAELEIEIHKGLEGSVIEVTASH